MIRSMMLSFVNNVDKLLSIIGTILDRYLTHIFVIGYIYLLIRGGQAGIESFLLVAILNEVWRDG